ncbi:MAG: hypothetical protein ABSC03_15655 [Verrucomicrobiota bacterium]|jgi:hypothetical protein
MRHPTSLLALLLGLALPTMAAVPPAEQLLPADTLAVLSVPDATKYVATCKDSPAMRLWNDPAMRPFRDKLMAKLTKEAIEPLERELGIKLADYSALAQGQVTLALTQNGWQGTKDPLPALLLLLDTRDQSDQLKKTLAEVRKKLTDANKKFRSDKIRDVEFTTLALDATNASPDLPQISFGQSGSLLLVGTNPKALEQVLARLAGGGGGALADQADFQADQPVIREALTYGWINVTPAVAVGVKLAAQAPTGNAEGPKPDKIIAALGLTGVKTLAFGARQGPDGATVDMSMSVPADQRKGIFKLIATDPKDASVPAFVPASATQFSRWRLDGQKVWAALTATVNDISPGTFQNMIVATLEAAAKQKDPNFDLQKNVIANLGDDVVSYKQSPRGTSLEELGSPPAISLIGSANAEQLLQGIRGLINGVLSLPMLPIAGAEIKEREFLGRKIYSLPLPTTPGVGGNKPAERAIMMAASGGYVALSMDAAILEEYLRSSETKPKPLAETPGLADAAQKVGGTATGLFGYQNDAETVRSALEALRSNADLFDKMFALTPLAAKVKSDNGGSVLKEWVDFSLLPPSDQITKYFGITVYAGSMTPKAYLLKVYTPTPPQLKK